MSYNSFYRKQFRLKLIEWAKSDKYQKFIIKPDLLEQIGASPSDINTVGSIIVQDVGDIRKQRIHNGRKRHGYLFPDREFLIAALEKANLEESIFEVKVKIKPKVRTLRILGECPKCGAVIVRV